MLGRGRRGREAGNPYPVSIPSVHLPSRTKGAKETMKEKLVNMLVRHRISRGSCNDGKEGGEEGKKQQTRGLWMLLESSKPSCVCLL